MKPMFAAVIAVTLCITGCDNPQNNSENKIGEPKNSSPVVAKVDDSLITQEQLNYQINKIVGDKAALFGGIQLQDKVLDSMISSRAMAQLMEQELSPEEKRELELKLQSYREELLVNQYIKLHAEPQPVTIEMVKGYYEENKDEFGGITERTFEYVSSKGNLSEQQRDDVIAGLSSLADVSDWKVAADKLQKAGVPIEHKRAVVNVGILEQPLKSLVMSTKPGSVSGVHMGSKIMRVRVVSERKYPPKPLAQVSADIREMLAPIMLKKSLKALSKEAKSQVEIEIR